MIRRIATLLCSLFLITVGAISPANAAEWSNDFESSDTTWTVIHSGTRSRSLAHQRVADFAHSGQGSESFQFQVNSESTIIRLEHALPDAAVIDELTTSVWVNSTRNGAVMKIRVVFPHQINPKTSKPAFVFIQGSRYESEGRWQKLECRAEEKKIHDQIVLMRSQFPVKDLRDAYVDKMIIEIPMESGTANFAIDDASFGPIVSPRVVAPAFVSDDSASSTKKRVKLRLGHLQVDGRPFFPIMTPYHGEAPRDLHDLGVNVVWIPDYQDNDLIDQLRDFDLWSTAVPPQSKSAEGHGLDAQFASLVPFSRKTEAIAFWMLGSKITPDMHKNILTWAEQVRTADRKFDRPLMGDVQGSERVSSRNISLLGTSRPVIQTTFPLRDYRDWLKESRNLAIPGSFVWTWIPTEPYPALASLRNPARQQPLYHEPEQLRLQLFAALAAGCQGIGYWSTTPLNDDDPLAVERRLAISQLNDELQLLGPILATANLKEQIPFSINGEPPPQFANVKVLSLQGRKEYDPNAPVGLTQPRQTDRRQTSSMKQRTSRTPDDMVFEAAFFRSPYGGLILPICYQEHAQFVPGAMTVRDVRILVSDVEDTASAYEITPTRIRYVPKDRVAGGVELKLSTLDMTTAILLTSDQKIKKAFQSRIRDLNSQYAQTTVELARAKFKRTAAIDSQLTSLGAALPDAFIQLSQVGNLLRDADQALERQEFSSACDKASSAMQYLRILQRAHWEAATRRFPSPASSPHTLCFQTLPDHWKMLKQVANEAEAPMENRLPTGNFEDFDQMIVAGWRRHEQMTGETVASTAQLVSIAHQGEFSLRLASVLRPKTEKPYSLRQQRIDVHSPPVTVRPGNLIQVSGWVRIRTPVSANLDGVMVYDNLLGLDGGLRWKSTGESSPSPVRKSETHGIQLTATSNESLPETMAPDSWQRFEILREVNVERDYVLTLSLGGLGDVLFDDVQIHVYEFGNETLVNEDQQVQEPSLPEVEPFSPINIDLLKKLNVLPFP